MFHNLCSLGSLLNLSNAMRNLWSKAQRANCLDSMRINSFI